MPHSSMNLFGRHRYSRLSLPQAAVPTPFKIFAIKIFQNTLSFLKNNHPVEPTSVVAPSYTTSQVKMSHQCLLEDIEETSSLYLHCAAVKDILILKDPSYTAHTLLDLLCFRTLWSRTSMKSYSCGLCTLSPVMGHTSLVTLEAFLWGEM